MRIGHYVAMLGIAIGISLAIAPAAQAAGQVNTEIPFDSQVSIPCNGDTVDASGFVHELAALTINGNNFSVVSHFNAQGVTGTSETTGAKYQGTGVTTDNFGGSFVNGQSRETFVNRFDFIGQGSAPNFITHETSHVTVNANGTITITFDNFTASCK
jgi:hypothetical protein